MKVLPVLSFVLTLWHPLSSMKCNGFPCSSNSPYDCLPLHWQCDGMNDCGDNSDEIHCFGSFPCGKQAPKNLIYDGKNAYRGQFPWLGKIEVFFTSSSLTCGATLISDQWIVTAAHCLENDDNERVET